MVHGCMVYTERAEIDSLWQQILVAPAMEGTAVNTQGFVWKFFMRYT